jgi:UDP-N-acetylmuramoylalanine--D-glutamate ligase
MRIALVGWGIESQSAYHYFGNTHTFIIVNEEPRNDFPKGGNIEVYSLDQSRRPGLVGNVEDLSYLDHIVDADLIIYQPSARKNMEKRFVSSDPVWNKTKTIQHLFFELYPNKDHIIGVTGTKGKGTTSTLILEMIKAAGIDAAIGGNIGVPSLDLISGVTPEAWAVLELSSFQLYKFPYSPHIAVNLMMIPEHIDEWHKTMDDYVNAKRNIFANQSQQDIAVYLDSNNYSSSNAMASAGKRIPYTKAPGAHIDSDGYLTIDDQRIVHKNEVALLGAHNLDNLCAAITAVWQVHHDVNAIHKVATSFTGLEHRLEFVAVINGVNYYDDSFGTTPDTTIVAMNAFAQQKVMIVGGHDKGSSFESMAKRLCQNDIRHVIFIGTTAHKIYDLAVSFGFDKSKSTIRPDGNSWTMNEIVNEARQHAEKGDIVLLSTGCASFGMFIDYKDRGNQFKEAVQVFVPTS